MTSKIPMNPRTDPFDWSGGHPALDFANTLDERPSGAPIERLTTYRELVRFAELAGLVEPALAVQLARIKGHAGGRIARRARLLREHLYDVLIAAQCGRPAANADLGAISRAVHSAHAARILIPSASPGLATHEWSPRTMHEIPLHACALAIERLLIDADRRKIRKCGAGDCNVFFLDTSKSRQRQWCSMQGCGNREKQRRWRAAER